ncbi:hypothetical protein AGR3A_Cc250042 [Agrobacterium tomkonis CFBP 6623]|uniref:Uncharacterized protein n=1 Tax=Agrobacterium tomkonis CFBP 6623 TaxID=1183432 RepID=A0A1S7PC81_9HYPH|nr:hypothetical protein AGR3A_Cc250042 [Agrobacterium tomkonis CFBP 6623]
MTQPDHARSTPIDLPASQSEDLTNWIKKKKPAEAGFFGAVEKTRTSTGCPTATSTLRVYQFRHDRIVVGVDLRRRGCM